MKRFLYSVLPTPLRIQGRSFFANYALDLRDQLTGRTEPGIPPRHLNISGGGPFRQYGENTVALCRHLGGLQTTDDVLDVGCGIGRTALALSAFLAPASHYGGFDIIRFAIEWCQAQIASRNPNFRFIHADLFNQTYNPKGLIAADRYAFPFASGSFTFAIATSLFTHLLPSSTENYLRETSRSLKPGARFLSTWFLLDERTGLGLASGRSTLAFPHEAGDARLHNPAAPEQAVAYRRDYITKLFALSGLKIDAVYHGDWSGITKEAESYQDIVVATKAS